MQEFVFKYAKAKKIFFVFAPPLKFFQIPRNFCKKPKGHHKFTSMGVTILLRLKSEAKFTAENTLRKGGFIMSEEKIKIPSQRLGTFIPHKTRLILNCLSDEQYGRILRQLDDYAFKGITPEFDNPMEEGMFGFLNSTTTMMKHITEKS